MPEEIEVETKDLQESIEELHKEREKEAQESAWTRFVALSTAFLAVIAAVAALKAGGLVNEAILRKNEAVLKQAQASDQWGYYQGAGIKANTAQYFAALVASNAAQAAQAEKYQSDAKKYEERKAKAQSDATEFEKQRDEANTEANQLMISHETFALSVTVTQVAIALSAIAALTKRKPVWYFSILVGVIGLFFFLKGYVPVAPEAHAPEPGIEKGIEKRSTPP
ncbi:MAG TPA: DUF4337 family protein [Chthonomonadaceae bacterium]|nr:DUF4337 family protein [Chthonomonadaceae bacterium]